MGGRMLRVRECEFRGNSAKFAGAVRINGIGSATIEDSLFIGNSASGRGGAICTQIEKPDTQRVEVKNTLFCFNESPMSPHIYNYRTATHKCTKWCAPGQPLNQSPSYLPPCKRAFETIALLLGLTVASTRTNAALGMAMWCHWTAPAPVLLSYPNTPRAARVCANVILAGAARDVRPPSSTQNCNHRKIPRRPSPSG